MLDILAQADQALFLMLNGELACAPLDAVMPWVTRFGDGTTTYLAAALALLVLRNATVPRAPLTTRDVWLVLFGLAAAMLLAGLASTLLKGWLLRPRPPALFRGLVEAGQVVVHTVAGALRRRSLPSGHTVAAFSAAGYVAGLLPPAAAPALALAALVGLSRVYLGVHFPADVLAGAAVGAAFGLAAAAVVRRGVLGRPSPSSSRRGRRPAGG